MKTFSINKADCQLHPAQTSGQSIVGAGDEDDDSLWDEHVTRGGTNRSEGAHANAPSRLPPRIPLDRVSWLIVAAVALLAIITAFLNPLLSVCLITGFIFGYLAIPGID